jgi:hypothetical protein
VDQNKIHPIPVWMQDSCPAARAIMAGATR